MAQVNPPPVVYNNVTTAELKAGFAAAATSIGTFFREFRTSCGGTPDERGLSDRFVVEMKKHAAGIQIVRVPCVIIMQKADRSCDGRITAQE